jgi:hypothetical protein
MMADQGHSLAIFTSSAKFQALSIKSRTLIMMDMVR